MLSNPSYQVRRILEHYKTGEVQIFRFENQWWQERNKEAEKCILSGSPLLSLFK